MLFQIAQGCYALNLSRATHNDLHHENIWVTSKDPNNPDSFIKVKYIVDGRSYNIRTNICCRLYDFDRAYAIRIGLNPKINGNLCDITSQCNYVANSKDFIKLLYYVYDRFGRARRDELLQIIIPDSDPVVTQYSQPISQVTQAVYRTGAFLQDKNDEPLERDVYNNYKTLPEIIDSLYQIILKIENELTNQSSSNQLPVTFTDAAQYTFTCNASNFASDGVITLSDCCYEK
jgi:hypothetical protein